MIYNEMILWTDEIRRKEITFSETNGVYQYKFDKPKDFIDGYCQINYDNEPLCIQEKYSHAFIFADLEWGGDVHDDGKSFIITLHKLPKAKRFQLYYRFDTESELGDNNGK